MSFEKAPTYNRKICASIKTLSGTLSIGKIQKQAFLEFPIQILNLVIIKCHPVIPATQEPESRELQVQSRPAWEAQQNPVSK